MNGLHSLLRSTIGRKLVMAITGLALIGFVIAHLIGNLQVFGGAEGINRYGAFLKSEPMLLWTARLGLLAVFLLHIGIAFSLRATSQAARPVRYGSNKTVKATVASLYMMETGLVILAFVVFHLLHYTIGWIDPEHFHLVDAQGRHDVHSMIVYGFSNPLYTAAYVGAMVFLGIHLSHAIASCLQTLGLSQEQWRRCADRAGRTVGWLIALGYISIPLGVVTGLITLERGVR